MWRDTEVDELDRYVDELNRENRRAFTLVPATLGDLAAIARWIKFLLMPVDPTPLFRDALRARLVAAARAGLYEPPPSWAELHRRELIIGAALGSAISLAGLAAVIARTRWAARNAA